MKKTVILILAILPIFLMVAIALTADTLGDLIYQEAESVRFIGEDGKEFSGTLVINEGDTHETLALVYPRNATDQTITYTSNDPTVCTVDENGVLTAVGYGLADIEARTVNNKTHILHVQVRSDHVSGVTLSQEEATLTVGDSLTLTATVEGPYAQERNVLFTSNNPAVAKVSASGKITAVAEGTAIITVTTLEGGKTASCTVTVLPGLAAIAFDFSNESAVTQSGGGYISLLTEIALENYLVCDENRVNPAAVQFYVKSGSSRATIDENNVLTLLSKGPVTVLAYVGDRNAPQYSTELKITLPME